MKYRIVENANSFIVYEYDIEDEKPVEDGHTIGTHGNAVAIFPFGRMYRNSRETAEAIANRFTSDSYAPEMAVESRVDDIMRQRRSMLERLSK